ncbi:MAG: virulence protein RhuM/Fic/DOC family protein [Candidatus Edwardsbacteria bacterium]|nr:virulence protein RhuM/Fic/DOC family protein [Candidatus Edwardsbacteria bacterium]
MKKKTNIIHSAPGGSIILYRTPGGRTALEVRLEQDTLWLSLNQIAALFDRDKSVISRHLGNVYKEGELARDLTVAFFATVQDEGGHPVMRRVEYFNLDAVISVGYRVNSKRGTQFRIWATGVLRDHILKGYTVNQRRLKELNQAVRLIADVANRRALSGDEATALLRVVGDYSYALELLDDYDHQRVKIGRITTRRVKPVTLDEARRLVAGLRARAGSSDLFGREKDHGLDSSLAAVMQTFGGREVYPSLEEKAANLLYLLVKDHPFVDGNKRIAAALFLWFLEKNRALYARDGSKRLADNALVAITLMIAESRPQEKDVLTAVAVNLISRRSG